MKGDPVSELRRRLQDDAASITAFTVSITAKCDSASLSVVNGFLDVNVLGGQNVASIHFPLDIPAYSTVGKLAEGIGKQRGYSVTLATDTFRADHPSSDIVVRGGSVEVGRQVAGGVSSSSQGAGVSHHLFADDELRSLLEQATTLHNPSYTLGTCPSVERPLVVLKAAGLAYRQLAARAARAKNVGEGGGNGSESWLALARDMDGLYDSERAHNARTIPLARADDSKLGSGDAVMCTATRRGGRFAHTSPVASAAPPTPPNLYVSGDDDVEDTKVRLTWSRSVEPDHSFFELWRDTRPQVERCTSGRLQVQMTTPGALAHESQYSRAGTSKQVFGIYRNYAAHGEFFFGTWMDIFGVSGLNTTFYDGIVVDGSLAPDLSILGEPLEPGSVYYYRLFAFNINRDSTPSAVLKVMTKAQRALFLRGADRQYAQTATVPNTGPLAGGTTVTVTGTNFVPGTVLYVNGKAATEVSMTSTQLVVTTPGFTNADFKNRRLDLVLISPSGLMDVVKGGWMYT